MSTAEAFSDYSRAKAMREVKALKLLQLFESGKLSDIMNDNTYADFDGRLTTWVEYDDFKRDVEDYLKDTD